MRICIYLGYSARPFLFQHSPCTHSGCSSQIAGSIYSFNPFLISDSVGAPIDSIAGDKMIVLADE